MHTRRTQPISRATIAEIVGIALLLSIQIFYFDWVGVIAAAIAFIGGRLAANLLLLSSMRHAAP